MTPPFIDALPIAAARPRLAFFDVDGTLLDGQGQLSEATVSAIKELQRAGVRTAFATGRPPFAIGRLQRRLNLSGPHVFYTGAYCVEKDKAFASHSLRFDQWRPIVDAALAEGLHCEVYYQDHYCIAAASEIATEHSRHLSIEPKVLPVAQWPKSAAFKLLLGANLNEKPNGLSSIQARFPEQHFAYAHLPSRPEWEFASVVSSRVDKPGLLHRLAAHLGCTMAEVVSFGDGGSDIDFLTHAGIGIAMGNAGREVQAAANFVTRSSCQDGVAYAISRLLERQ